MALSDITVIYLGKYDIYCPSNYYHEQPTPHAADVNSKFKIVRDLKYAYYHNERLPLRPIVTSETYYIDDVVVDEKTWVDVFKIISDNIQAIAGKVPKQWMRVESDDTVIWSFVTDGLQGKRADCVILDELCYDFNKKEIDNMTVTFEKDVEPEIEFELGDSREDYWYKVYGRSFDRLRRTIENINCRKDNNMISNIPMITNIPKIVDYKYIAENGVTIIKWSDNTSTTVTCDPKTADQYTGFVTAIAKKAFGNGDKMLSEWDRLVIKPIEDAKKAEEKAKIEAEKKAKEDKIHAEAKAKRDTKKAERKKKREIERLARQIADEYYAQELTEEAEKLAVKKYGVPKSYLDGYDHEYGCECGCKEFDNLNTEDISD